ncbi:MAG: uracil-DNA glycosylase [Armatimonadetes bacterium]|nr:uracil-DNA glycosylase [Armatimonadota bacterium]
MEIALPADWQTALSAETAKPYFADLSAFVDAQRETHTVFPPASDVFNAFLLTPLASVKVFILGQDPYHDDGQAHGLAFSVLPGVKPPPSLRNIFKELQSDLDIETPKNSGDLSPWARQGVLLLNTVLTVRAHEAASHKGKGWETFTDAVIATVSAKPEPVVFVLWGAHAQKKRPLIDDTRHTVWASAHPSPLSANAGFFGSKPFSAVNAALESRGQTPIDWRLS